MGAIVSFMTWLLSTQIAESKSASHEVKLEERNQSQEKEQSSAQLPRLVPVDSPNNAARNFTSQLDELTPNKEARSEKPECSTILTARMDPLVAATYRNQTFSPLLRLPDEILLEIMENLDIISLLCLRMTSRTFLRLFGFPCFTQKHHARPELFGPWMAPKQMHRSQKKVLAEYLSKDAYCKACLLMQTRRHEDGPHPLRDRQLECGGCKLEHSAGFFSATQREETRPETRLCIAYEGYIRVCDHVVIRRSDLSAWWDTLASCKKQGTDRFRTTLCDHASHHTDQVGRKCRKGRNTIELVFHAFDGNRLCLDISLLCHLPPPSAGNPSRPTGREIRRIFSCLKEASSSQHLVPPHASNELIMACVDPNICSCIDYEGHGLVNWQLAPRGPRSINGLFGQDFQPDSKCNSARGVDYHNTTQRSYSNLQKKDLGMIYSASIYNSSSREHDVYFTRRILVPRTGKTDQELYPGWAHLIDPESYGLSRDDAGRHITWCPDAACRNYHGRINLFRFSGMKFE